MEQRDKQDSLENSVMWVKTSLTNILDGMLGWKHPNWIDNDCIYKLVSVANIY